MNRLLESQRYRAQGYHPIPIKPRSKASKIKGWPARHGTPVSDRELREWFPGDENIALLLGPADHLLVLNANCKNGNQGLATIAKMDVSGVPMILTPSEGLGLCYRPPDPQRYPFPFNTHAQVKELPGCELRGRHGYQLFPSSVLEHGAYRFSDGYSLTRLSLQTPELPAQVRDLWITLDTSSANLSEPVDNPENESKTSNPQTPPNLTTITTELTIEDYTLFDEAEDAKLDRLCAAHVCAMRRLDPARLQDGRPFLCILHRETSPSATWFRTDSGYYIYHDWHPREEHRFYPVPDVYAALVTGQVERLPRPSRKTWRLRLLVEAGLLAPYPVQMRAVPDDAPRELRQFLEGFRLLCSCKWTYQEQAPTMYTPGFAAGWCRIPKGSVWRLCRWALANGFLDVARDDKGRLVYMPRKDA